MRLGQQQQPRQQRWREAQQGSGPRQPRCAPQARRRHQPLPSPLQRPCRPCRLPGPGRGPAGWAPARPLPRAGAPEPLGAAAAAPLPAGSAAAPAGPARRWPAGCSAPAPAEQPSAHRGGRVCVSGCSGRQRGGGWGACWRTGGAPVPGERAAPRRRPPPASPAAHRGKRTPPASFLVSASARCRHQPDVGISCRSLQALPRRCRGRALTLHRGLMSGSLTERRRCRGGGGHGARAWAGPGAPSCMALTRQLQCAIFSSQVMTMVMTMVIENRLWL
jgi:hypothetical protein